MVAAFNILNTTVDVHWHKLQVFVKASQPTRLDVGHVCLLYAQVMSTPSTLATVVLNIPSSSIFRIA